MGFIIDTCLWIAIERGLISISRILEITKHNPIYLSPVNVAEIRFGLELMKDQRQRQKALSALRRLRRKPMLHITAETGEIFGRLAAELERSGRGVDFRVQDVWLASQAIQRDFTLLTANPKDFRDIPGLKVIEVTIP